MPLVVENNIQSKHPDSFRILHKFGYKLNQRSDFGAEVYNHPSGHSAYLYSTGRWEHISNQHKKGSGASHHDLELHLNALHK